MINNFQKGSDEYMLVEALLAELSAAIGKTVVMVKILDANSYDVETE